MTSPGVGFGEIGRQGQKCSAIRDVRRVGARGKLLGDVRSVRVFMLEM